MVCLHQQIQQNSMISQNFQSQLSTLIDLIITRAKQKNANRHTDNVKRVMIGICGIPGSGKSTLSKNLQLNCTQFTVLPMDGFHLPRKQLDQEGIRRRGAPFTFNLKQFAQKLRQIKNSKLGTEIFYPDFDHAAKDPAQDAIKVPKNAQIIIVQGIYIFSPEVGLDQDFWDLRVWVDTNRQEAQKRGAIRHLECGIVENMEQAYERVQGSDRMNADYVLQNCYKSLKIHEDPQNVFIFKNYGTHK